MTAADDRMFGLPIGTPLETEPAADRVEATEMWRVALAHVGILGGWDRRIVDWVLAHWDAGTTATVASWLRRAWADGHAAGRIEGLDEAGDLRSQLDRVTRQLNTLTAAVQKVAADLAKAAPTDLRAADDSPAGRLMIAVDTAVIDLADAVEHLADPPACPQCATPQCGRCPADVLADRIAADSQVDAVRDYGASEATDEARDGGHVLAALAAAVASMAIGFTSGVILAGGHLGIGACVGAAGAVLGIWAVRHGARDGGAS